MKQNQPLELMKCQCCGRMLPVKAFNKFSITKCKRCAAKIAASRRKEKRNENKTR